MDDLKAAIANAADFDAAAKAGLELAATWTPDALAFILDQAMTLAALEGREAAFADDEATFVAMAGEDRIRQEFKPAIDFLTQKRGKPTRQWTDAMHGDHDRSFVVAGVTDMAMLDEFQAALAQAVGTTDIKPFAEEFDRLVEKYGWSYNGGRDWRIRTIFETNVRTSYMAGRLHQMRDPDMVKARPYWQYLHADTRTPKKARPEHLGWDRLVLDWNDPWWDIHFPPNDWLCSCGVKGLSRHGLQRLGKTGPDKAPETRMVSIYRKATGETVQVPEGIGYGWDYMPGDHWERGLVPSALIDEVGSLSTGRHIAEIDTPSPIAELAAAARPFKARVMADDLPDEDYLRAFLQPFGADIGRAAQFEDKTGHKMPISEEFFLERDGSLKIRKRDRHLFSAMMAEVIQDPDEIWIGVTEKKLKAFPGQREFLVERRYIRLASDGPFVGVMEVGRKWWEPVTLYPTTDKKGRFDLGLLDVRRGGKLLWKRK